MRQLIQVLRRLARSPMFTGVTLITLAAGIGANTAIFSVINGVLLKPLPYAHPEELVAIWHSAPGLNIKELQSSPAVYFTAREESRTLQDNGLWESGTASVTGLAQPEQVRTLRVTDGVLPILGIQPSLGRWFSRKDDQPGSPETAVLAYGYWQGRFGGDPAAIGRRIIVDGEAREIIGVLPKNFWFMDQNPSLILPFQLNRSKTYVGGFGFPAIARLKPGVSLGQANSDMTRMLPIAMRKFPAPPGYTLKMFEDARMETHLRPLRQDLVGDIGNVLWILMGTIGMVLLIACANVANLLLVRAEGRQQELAIRAALGAGWRRIAGELLFESVTLGLCGGALGLAVAYGALQLLIAMGPANLPRLQEISIDPMVLLFTLVISLGAGVLFGLIPVFKYAGPHLGTALRGGGRTLSQSRERHRARSILVIAQVALALVLLICSGLMIRTFQALKNVQPGFTRPQEIQTFRLSIPQAQVPGEERVVQMHQDILRKISAIPGVSSAGLLSHLPMDGQTWMDPIRAEDHVYAEMTLPAVRHFGFISPDLWKTMGTPLVAGRDFTWNDIYQKRPVVLVSENLARELWHDPASALGKRIRESFKGDWREIVGVAGDVRADGLDHRAPATVYWPILMKNFESDGMSRSLAYVIRSSRAGSESFVKEIRQAVWSVNPDLPVANARTLEEIYEKSLARTSFTLVMLAIAGGMALLLGVVGIYGVISYSVLQRTREIGIRMALGAQQGELTRMFLKHGFLLASAGVVCGFVAAIALTRLMTSLLFEISPVDPLTYCAVSIGLVAAAMLASYIPARRATRVDPTEALRAE